jgi:hypothetical protein
MKSLKVISRKDGFRRAGYVFGAVPVEIPLDVLSAEQIEALKAEPQLIVVETDVAQTEAEQQDPEETKGAPETGRKGGKKA